MLFIDTIDLTNGELWYKKLKETIDKAQQQPVWMSETKVGRQHVLVAHHLWSNSADRLQRGSGLLVMTFLILLVSCLNTIIWNCSSEGKPNSWIH